MAAANQVLYAGLLSGRRAGKWREGRLGTPFIIKLIIQSIRARLEGRRAFFAADSFLIASDRCPYATPTVKTPRRLLFSLALSKDVCNHPRTFCLLPISVLFCSALGNGACAFQRSPLLALSLSPWTPPPPPPLLMSLCVSCTCKSSPPHSSSKPSSVCPPVPPPAPLHPGQGFSRRLSRDLIMVLPLVSSFKDLGRILWCFSTFSGSSFWL